MTTRILHVVPSFWPATFWGGPIRSTKAICDCISAVPGFHVSVLTTDAAGLAPANRVAHARPMPYPVARTRRVAGHSVAPGLLARLPTDIRLADIVHLTGTYSFPTLWTLALARLFGKPVVWSLRGAVQATEDWPDAPRRATKRRFEAIAHRFAPRHTVLHVTSPEEEAASARRLPGLAVEVIPNAVDLPGCLPERSWRPDGRFRLLYLGRLHEKKGIDLLIDAVRAANYAVDLTVCGDGAPDVVAALRERADQSPRIRFLGETKGAAKTRAFAEADLFVLPSHSENFAISVAEALAHGVPVLTTTRTPWSDLEAKGAGRVIEPEAKALSAALDDLRAAPLAEMGARGRTWMEDAYSPKAMTQRFVDLYRSLLNGAAR